MWLLRYAFVFSFLLSLVFSRDSSSLFTIEPSQITADCGGTVFTEHHLNEAATAACTQHVAADTCSGAACNYLRKAMPLVTSVSIYNGPLYGDAVRSGYYLKWALPRQKVYERATNYAIVHWSPGWKTCKTIGAIRRQGMKKFVECKINQRKDP